MKDMMKMGTFLFIIAAVAGVLLAYTENLTGPRIEENRIKKLAEARREVLPEAKNFSAVEYKDPAGKSLSYVAGFKEDGSLAGVVLNAAPKGYAGPIEMVIGLSSHGKISGVKILSQKETPGLGTKLTTPAFLEPFTKIVNEKPRPIFLVKQDGGDIDAITAATISSRAFCSGIREGMAAYEVIKEELGSLKPAAPALPVVASESGDLQ